jgi:hypothetical protein
MPEKHKANRGKPKNVLRLPDLDHSKASVLQSLGSVPSKRTYGYAINDFIAWYCSEPRLAFGRTVVLRYRYELEARSLAPATIKLRLAAVRRLAYEAVPRQNSIILCFLRFLAHHQLRFQTALNR